MVARGVEDSTLYARGMLLIMLGFFFISVALGYWFAAGTPDFQDVIYLALFFALSTFFLYFGHVMVKMGRRQN